jgi:hypothetical protein
MTSDKTFVRGRVCQYEPVEGGATVVIVDKRSKVVMQLEGLPGIAEFLNQAGLADKPVKLTMDIAEHRDGHLKGCTDYDCVGDCAVGDWQTAKAERETAALEELYARLKAEIEEEIVAEKTERGGWTRESLAKWGVAWPPLKGWKRKLIADRAIGLLRAALDKLEENT